MSKPGDKKYKWVKAPDDHPYKTEKGLIQLHRLIAENIINRYLKPEEVVHHIDENTLNNNIDNLMIFANARDHNAFHMGAPTWSNDGIIWHSSKVIHTKQCVQCGKLFFPFHTNLKKARFCSSKCMNEWRRSTKNNYVTEIQNLLYNYNGNFSKVAKILNVSSSGIAKILKSHGLKNHSRDYKICI